MFSKLCMMKITCSAWSSMAFSIPRYFIVIRIKVIGQRETRQLIWGLSQSLAIIKANQVPTNNRCESCISATFSRKMPVHALLIEHSKFILYIYVK